jgi:hypothetical protein
MSDLNQMSNTQQQSGHSIAATIKSTAKKSRLGQKHQLHTKNMAFL